MRRITMPSMVVAGSAVLLLGQLVVNKADAQNAGQPPPPPQASADTLEEVVVTAEKRTENVQKTAIAITTISGEDIAKHAETELDTMLRNVPSLQVESTPQGGEIYVRGVGANGDSNFVDPSVSLSMDGIYMGRSERLASGLYDINHVEVLRGPQGTIYGRNADGGAVNVISNSPIIGDDQGRANLQLGNYSLVHVDAAKNIPINDELAFRVAAMSENRDGYFTNDAYASHVAAFRFKALYVPTDELSFQFLYDYAHQTGHWATTVPVPLPFAGPPPFVFNSTSDSCAGPNGGWLITQPNNPWYVDPCHPADTIDYKFGTVAMQADYKASWGTITFIPALAHSSRYINTNLVVGDDAFFHGSLTSTTNRENQKTAELRVTSPDSSAVKWVVGYFYLWSDNGTGVGSTQPFNFNLAGGGTVDIFDTSTYGATPTVSKAPFGQITYPVTDRFRVTGGLRYTQDSKSQAAHIVSVAIPGYDSGQYNVTSSYSATNYKAGIEFDVAPKSMFYAQVATGYKAGGFDTTATPPKTYGPEHVRDYELGIKNRFLDDKLQVNASVYVYDYTDLQVQFHVSPDPALPIPAAYIPAAASDPSCGFNSTGQHACYSNFQQYVANGGKAKNKGFELETKYKITSSDELDLSGTYADAKYGKFSDPSLASLDSEQIAATPRFTALLNYEHDWNLGNATLEAQVDSKWSSSYFSSVNNRDANAFAYQKAYTRSDASLTYDTGKWSAGAWVKNIEDKAQLQFGDFPLNRAVVNFPRTFGVNVSMKL